MCNKINILMTGSGAPGGPGILKCLQKDLRFNIFVADINPYASGSIINEQSFIIPSADSDDFVDVLLNICIKNNIKLVLPLVTRELVKLSNYKSKFKSFGINVLVSDSDSMVVLNNKALLLEHLKLNKIDHPKYEIVHDAQRLKEAVYNFGYPNTPVVVKPSIGNGSRGIRILDKCYDEYDLLFNQKPSSLYSSLEYILNAIQNKDIPEMVVSEYLPGDELTIDTVISNGNVQEILIRSRDTMRSGISTSGKFIKDETVENYIFDIINSFPKNSLEGNIGFQVKRNINEQYLLLESNPRIQGTSVASLGCGVNLPLLSVCNSLGLDYNYTKKDGVAFCRFYDEVFYEY